MTVVDGDPMDGDAAGGELVRRDGAAGELRTGEPVTRALMRGTQLAVLSERFHQAVFVGALAFLALATVTAGAFLPLRASAIDGRPPTSAIVAVLAVLLVTAVSLLRPGQLYRALRRQPRLELAPVLVAILLLTVASPLRNELWWPASAILMLLATLAPLRRALAYTLVVLLANLATHLVTGSIEQMTTVGIVGLWVGLPFWTATAGIIPDRMAAFLLRLNTTRVAAPPPPLRVAAWTDDASPGPPAADPPDAGPQHVAPTASEVASRLTARQLQVVVLLADGLRYRDVADCLSITAAQVHRHVAHAIARAGVRTVSELVALAVAEGVLPPLVSPASPPARA